MSTLTSSLIVSLIDRVTAPARAVSATINRLTAASTANAARMAAMQSRMIGAAGGAYALYKGLSAPINAAMEFESAMADVRKVVDFPTPDGFKQMGYDIRALSREMPIAADGIAAIVAAAGQSGIANAELLPFAEMAAKVSTAWDTSAGETGEALAKLKTALNLSIADTGSLADAINYLGNKSAASAPDILEVVKRVAPMAQQFGLSAEQAAAFGAAMVGSGFEAQVASTSFLNMGRALTKGSSATDRQSGAFDKLGLSAVKVAENMQKDATGTIMDVLARLRKVPAAMRAAVISDLFGDEARAIGPLINNANLLADTLELVADKTKYAGSAQAEYEERSKTSANAIQLFKNRVTDLAISIGNALLPGVNSFIGIIGPMITSLSDLAQRFPGVTRAIVGVTAGLVAFRVASIAAQYAGLFLKGAFLDASIAALKAGRAIGRIAIAPVVLGFKALRMGMLGLLNPVRLVTAAMRVLKFAVIGTGVGAILVGIALAGAWIYNNWSGIATMFEAFKGAFLRAIEPIMPMINPVIDGFSWVYDAVSNLIAPIDELGGGWARAGIEAGKFVGDLLIGITELPGKIAAAWASMSWSDLGSAMAAGIGSGFSALSDVVGHVFGMVDWAGYWGVATTAATNTTTKIGEMFSSIDWLGSISGVGQAISGIFERAASSLLAVDWASAGLRVGEMISGGLAGILDLGRSIFENLMAGGGSMDWAAFGATVAAGIAAFDWAGVGSSIVRLMGAAIGAGAAFLGGVFKGLFGDVDVAGGARDLVNRIRDAIVGFAGSMMSAGVQIAQGLWDGVIAKIDEMVAWFAGLPGRIVAAIGNIDIGSLIKWPTPPAWFSRLWGGGGETNIPAPAAPAIPGRASGGPVRAGGSYLVGERGPELVTFGQSGMVHDALKTVRIMRNAAMASAVALPVAAAPALPAPPASPIPAVTAQSTTNKGRAGNSTHIEKIEIAVHAAAGQQPADIAQEVKRVLSAELNALSRGAYSDGAN